MTILSQLLFLGYLLGLGASQNPVSNHQFQYNPLQNNRPVSGVFGLQNVPHNVVNTPNRPNINQNNQQVSEPVRPDYHYISDYVEQPQWNPEKIVSRTFESLKLLATGQVSGNQPPQPIPPPLPQQETVANQIPLQTQNVEQLRIPNSFSLPEYVILPRLVSLSPDNSQSNIPVQQPQILLHNIVPNQNQQIPVIILPKISDQAPLNTEQNSPPLVHDTIHQGVIPQIKINKPENSPPIRKVLQNVPAPVINPPPFKIIVPELTTQTPVLNTNNQRIVPVSEKSIDPIKEIELLKDEEVTKRPLLRNRMQDELFKEQARSAKYSFGTSIQDGISDNTHHRKEVRDGLKLSGVYSYSDGFFKRTVHYQADEGGYRVVKEDVEPIGDGPQINEDGRANVRATVGSDQILNYSITGHDIKG